MKHTEGKWEYNHNGGNYKSWEYGMNSHRWSWKIKGNMEEISHDELQAKANLIASAPELLEALKYVVRWHREHDSGEGELYGQDFVTTCIGAIKKAEGA